MSAHLKKSEIVVVRTTKLGETDAIVTGLTTDGNLIRGVVKGYRKPGSRLGGRLALFARTEVSHTPGRSLDAVSDARTVAAHAPLREDPDRMAAAAVVAAAAERLASTDVPEPRVFDLTDAALFAIESCPEHLILATVGAFLTKIMAFFGYRPEVETCAHCGLLGCTTAAYSCDSGGFLCTDCSSESASGVVYCSDALASWVDAVLMTRFSDIGDLRMPHAAAADVLRFSKVWLEHFTGSRLKPLDFLMAGTLLNDTFSEGRGAGAPS